MAVRALRGGGWHANHLLTLELPDGRQRRFVLRRWARAGWEIDDPDMTPAREASVLDRLARIGTPTPRVVAVDPTGADADVPALLETVLPGGTIRRPRNRTTFADRLAEPLAWIHAVPTEPEDGTTIPYRRFYDPASLEPPTWGSDRAMWQRAIELATRPAAAGASGFIHRDYHPGNVLWAGPPETPRVAGIVDWTSASIGPFAVDLGHMRWNLAAAYDRATADRFLATAQELGLADDFTPEWDVRSTLDVLPELRLGHDSAVSLQRTEDHVARALSALR